MDTDIPALQQRITALEAENADLRRLRAALLRLLTLTEFNAQFVDEMVAMRDLFDALFTGPDGIADTRPPATMRERALAAENAELRRRLAKVAAEAKD